MTLRGLNNLNLTGLAMMLLPIVMTKLLAISLGIGAPVSASASAPSAGHGGDHALRWRGDRREPTEQQRRALAHAQRLAETPFDANPLLYGGRAVPPAVAKPSLAQTHPLQMIMSTAGGNVALIDGIQYQPGDVIKGTAWRILVIDDELREVVLRHEGDDRRTVLRVD